MKNAWVTSRHFICLSLLSFVSTIGFANEGVVTDAAVDSKTYIVKLADGNDVYDLYKHNSLADISVISASEKLFRVAPSQRTGEPVDVASMMRDSAISYVHEDIQVYPRELIPNDPSWSRKWGLEIIEAAKAWDDLGTGGVDFKNREIVVAVVDGGFDLEHEDLVGNLWVNTAEIPGNRIDDDGNGYIDDVNGWNADSNSGSISTSSHGTHVAGIIGAEGDNSKGVVGVNWTVKIMVVKGIAAGLSNVLDAYEYIATQKQRWLDTDGAEGAFVVAINSSFGRDRANCASYPAWNDMFNKMGELGILAPSATANQSYDIDRVGDLPTGCTSDYMIGVTNTNNRDKLARAAWGKTHVDLGAPGSDIYSTTPSNRYANKSGTSMATPMVAGAIGFMYSVASPDLLELADVDPGAAARTIKDMLLTTVDPASDLRNKTVSEGRLNLYKAAKMAAEYTAPVLK